MISDININFNEPNDIYILIEKGEITPSEAIALLMQFENKKNSISASTYKEPQSKDIKEIMEEIDSLIGLQNVKSLVKEIHAFVEIQKCRKQEGLINEPLVMHMIFKGNPGTGKTTVARIIGNLFKELEVLPKGHLVEVERADLVGEYIGHTAQKTREQIKRALGGILFIDEAYSLARGGEKDFGKECIDSLVKAMEDYKDDLIVILAGYKDEMDWFLQINPGLRSRFPIQIEFNDYNVDELMQIAKMMAEKRQYSFSLEALLKFEDILQSSMNSMFYNKLGNARLVRNMIEKAIRRQALRLVSQSKISRISREDLLQIKPEDIPIDLSEFGGGH
ncbi:MAG: AAA family ATPase [Tepidanaerobacter acetatoxydans]|uniref:AAA family ATPase n=1 Tax=Tepidanaerobacter acetatoxydans TaxID=499229 RepID=UPI00350E34CB|nr:AAA family ATPase [Tepidanaerobacter acetatoxydans]